MKRAEVEPYFGSTVVMTVSIPNLDDALYIGRLVPFEGGSRMSRGRQGASRATQPEPRVVLQPLETVPAQYRQRAENGLALCPLSAIASIERVD
jgi:hypothetical protein